MRMKMDEGETPGVEMAPMIDCVFLLLIFFLVAATIRKKHMELPVQLPAGDAAMVKKAPDETLVISVFLKGKQIQYAMSTVGERLRTTGGKREIMTLNQLVSQMKKKASEQPGRAVRVDADVRVPYGKVAQVLDHLQIYNLKRIGLRTRDRK